MRRSAAPSPRETCGGHPDGFAQGLCSGAVINDILQPTHLLFVLVVALLVLGPKRLPEVGRSLGRGLRDFRSALNGEDKGGDDNTALAQSPVEMPSVATAPRDPAEHIG